MPAPPSPSWVSDIKSERPIIGQSMGIPETTYTKVIREHLAKDPDRLQYTLNDGTQYTLRQFYDLAAQVAKSAIHLGLQPFEGVAIHGFNSIEWFAADVGANLAAAIPAGIYTTNKPDVVAYILNHSHSRLLFVDDQPALEKALSISSECPNLLKIVIWGEYDASRFDEHNDLIMSWTDYLALGAEVSDADLEERMDVPTPESVCKLIYTSGTTGPPKAVMISHDNVVFTAQHFGKILNAGKNDRLVSFLPCSHIAANTIDIVGALINGIQISFADPDALKGTLGKSMKEVKPSVFVAVPRVFEKIHEAMLKVGANNGPVKRAIATWAKEIGRRASKSRDADDNDMPWGYTLANLLVFQNVKKALGLDECRVVINTSAPMQKATDEYFKSLNFRIIDLYGMSEATGPLTLNYPDYKAGTSGKVVEGVEVKLDKKDETGEGELCFRGRNMFMGYLGNEEESARTMDEEGYIHSGDLGRIDEDGFITITGRAKELLVTSGGENVAPLLVESSLITAIPAISRAFAIGDNCKFISALLIPYCDEQGALIGPAAAVNANVKTVEEAVKDSAWAKYLQDGVAKANEHAISNVAKVKQFRMLTADFSVDGGELTPTLKVKRKIVVEKYTDTIASIYGS